MSSKSGIHIKASHKGMLHAALGVPPGAPIPAGKLARARHSSSMAIRKMATFATNARSFSH